VLLTRPPLNHSYIPLAIVEIPRLRANKVIAYDLHVLGMPPAFILSQDQTLIHNIHKCMLYRLEFSYTLERYNQMCRFWILSYEHKKV
jgi:hypothetical protein